MFINNPGQHPIRHNPIHYFESWTKPRSQYFPVKSEVDDQDDRRFDKIIRFWICYIQCLILLTVDNPTVIGIVLKGEFSLTCLL